MNDIKYLDFEPEAKGSSFWKGPNYESTEDLMVKVNHWQQHNPSKKIINIETVQKYKKHYNSRTDDIVQLNDLTTIYIIPIIRVWYE